MCRCVQLPSLSCVRLRCVALCCAPLLDTAFRLIRRTELCAAVLVFRCVPVHTAMHFVKLNFAILNSVRFPQVRFAKLYARCVALCCVLPLHYVQLCSVALLLLALLQVTL